MTQVATLTNTAPWIVPVDGSTLGPALPFTDVNELANPQFVGDGVTDNFQASMSLLPQLGSLTPEFPVAVTITIGAPTVVTWTAHGLKPNQAFKFATTGALPTGIDTATTYYVMFQNITADTFTFSTVNNFDNPTAHTVEGPAVATSGTQSGTQSIILSGRNWINLLIAPGAYHFANFALMMPNGPLRLRYYAYGVEDDVYHEITTVPGIGYLADTWGHWYYDYIADVHSPVTQAVTLQTIANVSRYYVGGWIAIFALDLENSNDGRLGWPPNNAYFEYNRVTAINAATGVLSLAYPLQSAYLSTFPNFGNPPVPSTTGFAGGPAMICPMHPCWDAELHAYGFRKIAVPQSLALARRLWVEDCIWDGQGITIGACREWFAHNCKWGTAVAQSSIEVDKMCHYAELVNCQTDIRFQSQSPNFMVIRGHAGSISGTPKQITVEDSSIPTMYIGTEAFGGTSSCQIVNSRISTFARSTRIDDPRQPAALNNVLAGWTFTNGTLSKPFAGLVNQPWAIPGNKLYLNDMAGQYQNMGSPFTVLDVYVDTNGNFSIDTTLQTVALGTQTQAAVAISIASPAVVTWTAHGLAANTPVVFLTTGTLPTGITAGTPYYVVPIDADNFSLVTSSGGSTAVNTSGTQSGTQTAVANALHIRPHPCPRFTSLGNTGDPALVDMNGAVDEPLFSRAKRSFIGRQDSAPSYYVPNPILWGNLKTMAINVVQAATAGTLTITANGFTPQLLLHPFSQVIDLTYPGLRTITPAGFTGGGGSDSLGNYGDWMSGPVTFQFSGVPSVLSSTPLVEWEAFTDQGITRFAGQYGMGVHASHENRFADNLITQRY